MKQRHKIILTIDYDGDAKVVVENALKVAPEIALVLTDLDVVKVEHYRIERMDHD